MAPQRIPPKGAAGSIAKPSPSSHTHGPRTRSHKPAAAAAQPTRTTSASWDLVDHPAHSFAATSDDDEEFPTQPQPPALVKQTEAFGEKIDEFLMSVIAGHEPFEVCLALAKEYGEIAKDAVDTLRRESERARVGMGSVRAGQKEEMRRIRAQQQEADVWDLFTVVLEGEYDPDRIEGRRRREEERDAMGAVHRYTTESELWERFLLDDDAARQKARIKSWLERAAGHQESGIKEIVEELEAKAGRGRGLWAQGCLHTREKLKGAKRLRGWPSGGGGQPLPKLQRTDNGEMLVVALDPDAVARQNRTLEKPDAYFERATWIACWEMLRRGQSWDDVSEWCAQRREGWRAASVCGDSDASNPATSAVWREMCYRASQSSSASDYEAACYGLMGGNAKAMEKVCRTVDDHIYAYFSSSLLQHYQWWLSTNYPDRVPFTQRETSPEEQDQTLARLIRKMREKPTTTNEAIQPMKILQSYLLANDLDSLVHTLGHAIAHTDAQNPHGEKVIIPLQPFWPGPENVPEAEIALDTQTLRIATHITMMLRALHADSGAPDNLEAEENVLVAYIQALRAEGKRDAIPIYASRLSPERSVVVMSRVMADVGTARERVMMVKLMGGYAIDVVAVLNEHVAYVMDCTAPASLGEQKVGRAQPLRLLEVVEDAGPVSERAKLYPGLRIKAGFLAEELTEGDERVVDALQWFKFLVGGWTETFAALAAAVRGCLFAGRIACALSIIKTYPYARISTLKTPAAMGRSINIMAYSGAENADEEPKFLALRETSAAYYELEQFLTTIAALATWADAERAFTAPTVRRTASAPSSLREAKSEAVEAMQPLLTAFILAYANDGSTEAAELKAIRTAYLPEIVLGYASLLHTAGAILSRDALLDAMDLGVTVANGSANGISESFVKAGRMRELVDVLARTSRCMLLMKDLGGPRKGPAARRSWEREGRQLGVWEIGVQGGD